MTLEELEQLGKPNWKEISERNGFILESLLIKITKYLDDQAKEELQNTLDEEHRVVWYVVTKFGIEL